jgi:hypothetical protein
MAVHKVKWYNTLMGDAPLTGAGVPGGLIALYLGCLIDGFNELVPTSITYDIPTDLCTATFAAAHGYLDQQIIESLADEPEFTGQFRVLESTSLTISWAPDTTPGASASGTLGVRTPEVGGWEIAYHDVGGFELILKRISVDATPFWFRIENDQPYGDGVGGFYGSYLARITVLADYVDENEYTIAGTGYFAAGWTYAASEGWIFVADHLLLYHGNRHASGGRRSVHMLGDINSVHPGDRGHCAIYGQQSDSSDLRWNSSSYRGHNRFAAMKGDANATEHRWLITNYAQDYPPVAWQQIGYGEGGAMSGSITYPNPCDGSMIYSTAPLYVMETGSILRGFMPGVVQPLQNNNNLHNVVLTNVPGFNGAPILNFVCQTDETNNGTQYLVAFRLDDWRVEVG